MLIIEAETECKNSKSIEIMLPSTTETVAQTEELEGIKIALGELNNTLRKEISDINSTLITKIDDLRNELRDDRSFYLAIISLIIAAFYPLITTFNFFFRKAKLVITFNKKADNMIYDFSPQPHRMKFSTLHVENKGKVKAKDTFATLTLMKGPSIPERSERHFYLHWADTEYNPLTNSTIPIEIKKRWRRRLDVAFTKKGQKIEGCWIATGFSLYNVMINNFQVNQFYLPPGKYRVRIDIECDDGKGDSKEFEITSPKNWDDLNIKQITKK